jgi:hypothetical protein
MIAYTRQMIPQLTKEGDDEGEALAIPYLLSGAIRGSYYCIRELNNICSGNTDLLHLYCNDETAQAKPAPMAALQYYWLNIVHQLGGEDACPTRKIKALKAIVSKECCCCYEKKYGNSNSSSNSSSSRLSKSKSRSRMTKKSSINSGGKKTKNNKMPLRECKMCGFYLYCNKECARDLTGGKVIIEVSAINYKF